MNHKEIFFEELKDNYYHFMKNDPDFATSVPETLALKITEDLSKYVPVENDPCVEQTCKRLGIKHTLADIANYLNS